MLWDFIGESMSPMPLNSKQRFSTRVADYVKYRPDYPRSVVAELAAAIGLSPAWVVADIGCGSGISCRMFLEHGNTVFGVEPNPQMRAAAESEFAMQTRFHAIDGSAEATHLPEQSIDLVIAAQAFHWFDRAAFAPECCRILRRGDGGYVAVVWNQRLTVSDPFAVEYDALLHRYGTDYKEVAHRKTTVAEFEKFFGVPFRQIRLPNHQEFDLPGLVGRVRSSSYTPLPGQPGHAELFAGIEELFGRHAANGLVRFTYETELFFGRVVS